MKQGRSLVDLAKELERRADNKKDYVVKTSALSMSVEAAAESDFERLLKLNVATERFGLNEIAHDQIGQWCDIPSKYYEKCRKEDAVLLADNVNAWLHKKETARMVRTLDGTARAFLSDRYRPMENEDLANAILPIILDSDKFDLMSCDVTDRRLYLKVVGKELSRELAKTGNFLGDGRHKIVEVLFPAIVISNSEVGQGSLSIQRALYNSGCSNLGIYHERSMKKYHVGARHDLLSDDLYAMLSDDTRKKTDEALWGQVRDVVTGAFDQEHFDALIDQLEGAKEDHIDKKADVVKVVKLASSRLGIREGEQPGILQALIEGGDLSRYGLHNAVTRFAQDKDLSYDRATELERIGAEVIELPKSDWRDIAMAS
jgi:hypothetical protein